MDKFTRYNRKSIDDRKIDTLIGLSKGILADGIVNQKEAEFLLNWLIQSRQASDHPVILNLLDKVEVMLNDRLLDAEEAQELLDRASYFWRACRTWRVDEDCPPAS